jgi:hypothetical protein
VGVWRQRLFGSVWAPRLRRPGCDFRRRGGQRILFAGGAESGVGRRRSAIRIRGAGLGSAGGGAIGTFSANSGVLNLAVGGGVSSRAWAVAWEDLGA